jgi:hypothetical protein
MEVIVPLSGSLLCQNVGLKVIYTVSDMSDNTVKALNATKRKPSFQFTDLNYYQFAGQAD